MLRSCYAFSRRVFFQKFRVQCLHVEAYNRKNLTFFCYMFLKIYLDFGSGNKSLKMTILVKICLEKFKNWGKWQMTCPLQTGCKLSVYKRFRGHPTKQKMKFSIKDFFSECDRIRRKLRIWEISFFAHCPERLLNVLFTLNLRPLSWEEVFYHLVLINSLKRFLKYLSM